MKRNPYYTWLRNRTATHHFANLTEVGVRPVNTNDQILDLYTKDGKKWLPTLRNRHYNDHMTGRDTFYFQGNGRASAAEMVVMIDVDCKKSRGRGTKAGAFQFAAHLKHEFFPTLYFEPSTNGNGVHGYLVLRKLGLPAREVNQQLRVFEQWLKQEAQRTNADVEGVEIKGTCPVFEFEERRIVKIKAGTNAKLPRGDIRATTHLDITELAKFVPVEEKVPVVRKSPYVSSSASWRPHAITPEDLAGLASLRKLAARLGTPSEKCSGRVAVTVEDVAVFLLLLRFFRGNMNENGTLPYARFEGLWTALFRAGDIDRAFNPKRFAAIRNHLSSLLVDGEALLEWEDETFTLGRACKWSASEKLMELIEQEQEREKTSSTETRFLAVEDYPRPRASWEDQREEKAQIIALIRAVSSLYDKKRRLAA